mgnify:FL=1
MFLNFDGTINRLRSVGSWEAVSYLLLLFVAMPLKYIWHKEAAVEIVGMLHGLLWMVYVVLAVFGQIEGHWRTQKTLLFLLASLLPFGPFVADAKLLRPMADRPRKISS